MAHRTLSCRETYQESFQPERKLDSVLAEISLDAATVVPHMLIPSGVLPDSNRLLDRAAILLAGRDDLLASVPFDAILGLRW